MCRAFLHTTIDSSSLVLSKTMARKQYPSRSPVLCRPLSPHARITICTCVSVTLILKHALSLFEAFFLYTCCLLTCPRRYRLCGLYREPAADWRPQGCRECARGEAFAGLACLCCARLLSLRSIMVWKLLSSGVQRQVQACLLVLWPALRAGESKPSRARCMRGNTYRKRDVPCKR